MNTVDVNGLNIEVMVVAYCGKRITHRWRNAMGEGVRANVFSRGNNEVFRPILEMFLFVSNNDYLVFFLNVG